jgi:pimeloyl-ACP methyl ester carboxylesterase
MNSEFNKNGIHGEVYGEGKPVILLHAMGSNSEMWHDQVKNLSSHFKVVVYDIRGFGRSLSPPNYDMNTWVEDLSTLMTSLKIEKACVVGFSMGGLIALRFAIKFPDLLQGLVLSGSLGELAEPGVQLFKNRAELVKREGIEPIVENTLNGFADDFKGARPEIINWYSNILRKNDPEQYAYACKCLWESAGELPLTEVTSPVLVMRGTKDPLIPSEAVHRFKERLATAVMKEIPDCGHFVPIEQPEGFNTTLEEFLNTIF